MDKRLKEYIELTKKLNEIEIALLFIVLKLYNDPIADPLYNYLNY